MKFNNNLIVCLALGIFFTSCKQIFKAKKSKLEKTARSGDFYNQSSLQALPHGAFLLFVDKSKYNPKDTTECGFLLWNSRSNLFMDLNGNILGSKVKDNIWSDEKVYHNNRYYSLISGNDPKIVTYDTNLIEKNTKKLDYSMFLKSDFYPFKIIPIDSNTFIAYDLSNSENSKGTRIHKEHFYRISLSNGVTNVVTQDEEYNYFKNQYCFLNQKNEIISVLFSSENNFGTEIFVNKYNLEFKKIATEKFKTAENIYGFNPILLSDNETIMAVSGTSSNNIVITKITVDLKVSQATKKRSFVLNNIPNNQKKLYFAEIENLNKKLTIIELTEDFNFKKVAEFNENFFPNYINKTEKGLVLYNLSYLINDFMPIIEFSSIDEKGNRIKKRLFESNIKINCPPRIK